MPKTKLVPSETHERTVEFKQTVHEDRYTGVIWTGPTPDTRKHKNTTVLSLQRNRDSEDIIVCPARTPDGASAHRPTISAADLMAAIALLEDEV